MKKMGSRYLVLPFHMGCLSHSTSKSESNRDATKMVLEEERSPMEELKRSWSYVSPSRSNISKAMHRIIRVTFKSFTHIFAYKDFEDIETKTEMVIGFPTDVKHVTHIGYDGSMTTNPEKNWNDLQPPETHYLPSVSLKQLELATASQTERRDL